MKRVLVVDDELAIASSCALVLQTAGFDAKAVFSGEEAVEAASSYQPDLLLTDISMGEMSGIEAATIVMQSLPNCKVLFVSGQIAMLDVLKKVRGPAFEFDALAKPVHPAELIARVAQLVACSA